VGYRVLEINSTMTRCASITWGAHQVGKHLTSDPDNESARKRRQRIREKRNCFPRPTLRFLLVHSIAPVWLVATHRGVI
jgi:hypothetical protein